jgi:signal transduction histidine kinase
MLVGTLTLAGAVAIGGFIRDREARALEVAEETAHEAVLSEVEHRLHDKLGALERLAANWERRRGLQRAEFEAEAGRLARDFSFFQAIEWVDSSFHVRWVVPLAGNEEAQGLALAFEPRRRKALEESRDGGVTTLSRPIQLVQGGLGFIVNVPLEVDGSFDGFVLGVYRADDLLSGLLRNVAPGFGVRISDDGELLYEGEASNAVWSRVRIARLQRSPRLWSIEVAPQPDVVATYQTRLPLLVVVAGAAFALSFAFTAQLADSRRIRNRQLAAEVKRREGAEQELSRVIDALPDHVWSGEITPEGFETLYYSPVIANITGRPVGTFEGSLERWYEIVHEEDLEMLKRAHAELLKGQRDRFDLEYRILRADGTLCWVRERVRSESTKHGMRLDGVTSDITEAKRAEEERLRVEKEMMLLLERERITREMHDGLGGQLVSTIAMLERGRSTQSEVTEALRRALDDMRIVIDSLDPTTTDLTTSLGKLRVRLEPLLRRNGIELRWRVEDGLGLDEYPPEQSLHFLRIIQEAVTNAIMHAKASEVSVRIHAGDGSDAVLIVEIRDDGEGSPPDVVHAGRGIGNMKSRAKALGAEFRFDRENSGTCIELRVPAPR